MAQGDAAKVQELLKQGKNAAETFEGWSLLMKASEGGNEVIMQMMLYKNVDVEAANKKCILPMLYRLPPFLSDIAHVAFC